MPKQILHQPDPPFCLGKGILIQFLCIATEQFLVCTGNSGVTLLCPVLLKLQNLDGQTESSKRDKCTIEALVSVSYAPF